MIIIMSPIMTMILINRYFNPYPQEVREYVEKFSKLNSADKIIQQLKNLANVRVLVVGEAILDQYCYCIPLAKSPKEFIIATKFSSEENFGAATGRISLGKIQTLCPKRPCTSHFSEEDATRCPV